MNGPQYRFHGRVPPEPGRRQPLAAVTAADAEPGVAVIRLYDVIDSWGGDWGASAKEFAATLDSLSEDTSEIRLHINSPGGEVFEGIAIMNLLRAHRAKVVTVVDGLAASAASFIAVSSDEVVMSPNTQLMIHDAWGFCMGNAKDMHDLGDLMDHLSNNIASIYAAKAGGSTTDWRTAMLAESWYSADEAVAAGLADRVAEPPSTAGAGPAPADRFDLSVFQYAGRAAAPGPVPVAPVPAARAPMTVNDLRAAEGLAPQSSEATARALRLRRQLQAARHGLSR